MGTKEASKHGDLEAVMGHGLDSSIPQTPNRASATCWSFSHLLGMHAPICIITSVLGASADDSGSY